MKIALGNHEKIIILKSKKKIIIKEREREIYIYRGKK
jgi:hypothetical protein